MLDMIKPTTPGCITLADLKRCKMTPIFFDTFFNLEKYMEHEQRDPFAQRDNDDVGIQSAGTLAIAVLILLLSNFNIYFAFPPFAALRLGSVRSTGVRAAGGRRGR